MNGTRKIPLTQGQFVLVDEADFGFLNKFKWFADRKGQTFYAARGKEGRLEYMHRIINKTPERFVTDHINGNGLDNRRSNLRTATIRQNVINNRMRSDNTSGYRGVTWDKSRKKWKVQTTHNNKQINIGRFDTVNEAYLAYLSKDHELRGEEVRKR